MSKGMVMYSLNGVQVTEEEFMKASNLVYFNSGNLKKKCVHIFKRYVGLTKVIDYCDCGFEKEIDWKELSDESKIIPKA